VDFADWLYQITIPLLKHGEAAFGALPLAEQEANGLKTTIWETLDANI